MGWFSRKKKKEEEDDVIRIRLSGDETLDSNLAFDRMGISSLAEREEILKDYTWHYLNDLDENMECTMQLVQTDVLESVEPFLDSRDVMEELTGIKYIRKEASEVTPSEVAEPISEVDLSDIRVLSLSTCNGAGYKPASSLPWIKEMELRPAIEIAGRLNAIKALVLWLMIPPSDLPDEKILNFINSNYLNSYLTDEEKTILVSPRDDEELRNSIGWKFEQAWPLAWYFGYVEPECTGQMMAGDQMQEILMNYSCAIDDTIESWISGRVLVNEEEVFKKEDLFYCLHNAVRSAQMGSDTVPEGFDPVGNGGVIHERRHSLTWMISRGVDWGKTDLST